MPDTSHMRARSGVPKGTRLIPSIASHSQATFISSQPTPAPVDALSSPRKWAEGNTYEHKVDLPAPNRAPMECEHEWAITLAATGLLHVTCT